MRRLLGIVAAGSSLAALSLLAPPANAVEYSTTIVCTGGNASLTTSTLAVVPGDRVKVVRDQTNDPGTTTGTAAGAGLTPSTGQNILGGPAGFTWTVGTGFSGGSISFIFATCGPQVNLTLTLGSSGGGGSSSSVTAPSLETLTLQVSTGNTTCTGGSPTGYTGSWLQLPAADSCSQSGPDANPNAKLLGWATDPIFPVSVAQQIVDLKYGPIDDYFYGMRMIFIPAGGWTFVSSSNNLYPIWSS